MCFLYPLQGDAVWSLSQLFLPGPHLWRRESPIWAFPGLLLPRLTGSSGLYSYSESVFICSSNGPAFFFSFSRIIHSIKKIIVCKTGTPEKQNDTWGKVMLRKPLFTTYPSLPNSFEMIELSRNTYKPETLKQRVVSRGLASGLTSWVVRFCEKPAKVCWASSGSEIASGLTKENEKGKKDVLQGPPMRVFYLNPSRLFDFPGLP